MAVFFIISGWCYKATYSDDISKVIQFFKRKIITLWIPFALWNSVFFLFHNFFIKINIYTNNEGILFLKDGYRNEVQNYLTVGEQIKNIIKSLLFLGGTQLGGALWFLRVLFLISIVYVSIDFLIKRTEKIKYYNLFIQGVISFVFLGCGFVCSKRSLDLHGINTMFSCYGLFYFGVLIRNKNLVVKKTLYKLIIFSISVIILIVGSFYGEIDIGGNSYTNPAFFILMSLAGWNMLYYISSFLDHFWGISDILEIIGKNTMTIAALHFLSFKVVSYIGILILHYPLCYIASFPTLFLNNYWWILYTIVGVSIPVLVSITYKTVIHKIKQTVIK